MRPKAIYEGDGVYEYLSKHQILEQYKKVKGLLLTGQNSSAQFRKRNPKSSGIYYFRVNKKYRAIWKFDEDGDFRVAEIDDHQS